MRTVETTFRALLTAATCLTAVTSAMAQTAPAPAAEAPPPGYWINGIHLSAVLEAGILANTSSPKLNNGHLFTDHPNQPNLNQLVLGAEKKLDPKATGFDWGFKLAVMYGSDARYTHYLGFLDQAIPKDQRNQLDVIEANGSLHIPVSFFAGGVDVKAGLYPTPLGAEVIDPTVNAFYTHSYIFNYGLPLKHTGILATIHATSMLDIWLGVDTGTNTTFGPWGDNNGAVAGIVGFGLNLMDGALTVLALTHFGPENATRALSPAGLNANSYMRFYNDIVVIWKATDKLTLTGELNWARDDFGGIVTKGTPDTANAFGIAGYASYALTDTLTLNARGEIFRDDNGFFVAGYPGNYDAVYTQKGIGAPLNTAFAVPPATYGAITLGVTYKPEMPAPITGLAIRPEIRYDQVLSGRRVFNGSPSTGFKDNGQFTIGADVILTF